MRTLRFRTALAVAAVALLGACTAKEQAPTTGGESADAAGSSAPATAAGGEQTPDAGGQVVKVEMLTDDQGNNVFRPADVEVRKGDVLRFTLVNGVHNVHFVADSNKTLASPPPASDMLQLAGQTYDVKVTWEPGRYFYQCDPHALLGMVGHVTVK